MTYMVGLGVVRIADPAFVRELIGSRTTLGNILFLVIVFSCIAFLFMMFALRNPAISGGPDER
jgi:hypothetical protein